MSILSLNKTLADEKLRLIQQCAQDRNEVDECLVRLEQQTSWTQLALSGMTVLAPRWKLLVPVLAFVIPRLAKWIPASPKVKSIMGSLFSWGQRAAAFAEGLKIIPKLLPGR